ncbi:MAG: HAMP domain-containing histidine kinase [Prevotella sp.]|nr:HAMP domain-containing histidine kinase [Prevotella sp.]
MRKQLIILLTLFMTVSVYGADDALKMESKRRIDHICDLYNYDKNDSLILQAPIDLAFHKEHGFWEHYYETWLHLVNTYVFSGKVNTALQEVKLMHKDATERKDKYGLALANYAMGNAYINMGYLEESVRCYRQSLSLIQSIKLLPTTVNDIFSYYCDALNGQRNFEEMRKVTAQWKAYLEEHMDSEREANRKSNNVWWAYYYIACAQQHLGLDQLDSAAQDLDEVEKRAEGSGAFIPMSVLFYRAQLCLQRKEYQKAFEYNDRRYHDSQSVDDKSSLVLIYEQRAAILNGLGRNEEAVEMYKSLYDLQDSIYKKDARTQINELSTLFHVNELELEQQLAHSRNVMMTAIVIALALALLVGYWYWMNRRLKRKNAELAEMSRQLTEKNEELTIALDHAGESDRMKSNFIKNISHEIRTPLNILSGFSQMMAMPDADLPDEVRRDASLKIQENTNRITTLINQLLALSETNSRTHIERSDDVPVNQLCVNAVTMSAIADKPYHFDLVTEIPDDLMIRTSMQYATSALVHLLKNAMKFTPSGGTIRLHCVVEDGFVKMAVEDTGCGVPADKAEDIFREFVQLDEFKDGVGIGLPLSRNVARRLGGDVVLDTSYTEGARFILTLPV